VGARHHSSAVEYVTQEDAVSAAPGRRDGQVRSARARPSVRRRPRGIHWWLAKRAVQNEQYPILTLEPCATLGHAAKLRQLGQSHIYHPLRLFSTTLRHVACWSTHIFPCSHTLDQLRLISTWQAAQPAIRQTLV
jgi:hypothetical protein